MSSGVKSMSIIVVTGTGHRCRIPGTATPGQLTEPAGLGQPSFSDREEYNEPTKNELRIEIRPVELATATVELQKRLAETQATVRRLEEAKIVSQETMKIEVSV